MAIPYLSKKKKRVLALVISILVFVGAFGLYAADYYPADQQAIAAFAPNSSIEVRLCADGSRVYLPQEAAAGFIFYPGGKVEHTAYEPLMKACAQRGILCVLVEMPFRLAVFDINAADGIAEQYPEIDRWYIGGHSLGGSMAASYLEKNADLFEGLVLLGAYSASDLSQSGLSALSVYGSEDKVLNMEKYRDNRTNLPADTQEIVIEGGCHAGFGLYGPQKGDGTPSVSAAEQIDAAAEAIAAMAADQS